MYLKDYPSEDVCIACAKCRRKSVFRKSDLVKVYGILQTMENVARYTAQFRAECFREDCGVAVKELGEDDAVTRMTQGDVAEFTDRLNGNRE